MAENPIALLKSNKTLQTQEQIQTFYEVLGWIEQERKIDLLPQLYEIFTDSARRVEPLQSLQTYIESFDIIDVIDSLINATPNMLSSAPNWLRIFYTRLLHNEEAIHYLATKISSGSETQIKIIKSILVEIPEEEIWGNDDVTREKLRRKVNIVLSI
jgi:hypothetical protein